MTRILALTAIETQFRGRLVETQFLSPLVRAVGAEPGTELRYLSLTPVPFYFSRKNPWGSFVKGQRERARFTSAMKPRGLTASYLPIAWPWHPKQFNLTRAQAITYLYSTIPILNAALNRWRPELIIARSYPAALLARWARAVIGVPYLFDLRGMYPEECVNAGAFAADSEDHGFWKRRERQLIADASRCLAVSEPFAEYIRSEFRKDEVDVIPCCVDAGRLKYDPTRRASARARFGLKDQFVLLHLGSFGTPGDRGLVAKYLQRFRRARPDAILLVACGTKAFVPGIRSHFLAQGLTDSDFIIVHPDDEGLKDLLALADAGLLLERKVANTKVCLSVKLGEYLASGLPVICTPHVEGAARLVSQYRCGLVVDPDDEAEPQGKEREFLSTLPRLRDNGFRLVDEVLSEERCARKWRNTIHSVMR